MLQRQQRLNTSETDRSQSGVSVVATVLSECETLGGKLQASARPPQQSHLLFKLRISRLPLGLGRWLAIMGRHVTLRSWANV
jgi:hypothetical protein